MLAKQTLVPNQSNHISQQFAIVNKMPFMPRGVGRKKGLSKYPFAQLKKGQGFYVEIGDDSAARIRACVSQAACKFQRELGTQYTVYHDSENNRFAVRRIS